LSTAKRHDDQWAARLSVVGQAISRYGLALTLAWIGFGKYIKMEARVLIEHGPLMSWVYDVFSANIVARGLGTLEIAAAILIVTRPVSAAGSLARCGALGAARAIPAQRRCAAWCCGVHSRRGDAGAPRVVSF
jgi:Protein of unknown function, DUF417